MSKFYTYSIHVETLEIKATERDVYPGEYLESDEMYASYNDDGYGCVYAESIISAEHTKQLVINFCSNMDHKFAQAVNKML